ncbi:MAG: hypothetical protein LQ340_005117 [Diploschistes diacapsis]|nr:MAG: hypothetical protein LQ340_005117 [Diploschistes diacapsis]
MGGNTRSKAVLRSNGQEQTQTQTRSQLVRLSPKIWERNRALILRLYETHSLAEVIGTMERRHGFKASKMAYKKKLGRWGATKKQQQQQEEGVSLVGDDVSSEGTREHPVAIEADAVAATPEPEPETAVTTSEATMDTIPVDPGAEDVSDSYEAGQFGDLQEKLFGSLFSDSRMPSKEKVRNALDALFEQHMKSMDLFSVQRILSAYDFVFGPESALCLERTRGFCVVASAVEEPVADHARLYIRTIAILSDNTAALGESWNPSADVKAAINFWLSELIDGEMLLRLTARISRLYARDKPGLCPALEPYLELAERCPLSDRADMLIWSSLEKMLQAMYDRLKSIPLSDEEDHFVTRLLTFVWRKEQSDKTFLAHGMGLVRIYDQIKDSMHISANFHGILLACIMIQAYIRDANCPPNRDMLIPNWFGAMRERMKMIVSKDQLRFIQDMLCRLATDCRKGQDWLHDDFYGLASILKTHLAKLCWDVFCAIEDCGFEAIDLQTSDGEPKIDNFYA